MRYSRRLCVLNLAELSAKHYSILFMCASCSEGRENKYLPEKERKRFYICITSKFDLA